jgi:hypothetical protein
MNTPEMEKLVYFDQDSKIIYKFIYPISLLYKEKTSNGINNIFLPHYINWKDFYILNFNTLRPGLKYEDLPELANEKIEKIFLEYNKKYNFNSTN